MASQAGGEQLKLWMEYAAELGDYECRYRLGLGREENDEELWLQECAEHGVADAQFELGMHLLQEYEESSEAGPDEDWDCEEVLDDELSEMDFPVELEGNLRLLGWKIMVLLGTEAIESDSLEQAIRDCLPEEDDWDNYEEDEYLSDEKDFEEISSPIVFANLAHELKERLENRWADFLGTVESFEEDDWSWLYDEAVLWIREAASHKHRKAMEWLKENIDEEE